MHYHDKIQYIPLIQYLLTIQNTAPIQQRDPIQYLASILSLSVTGNFHNPSQVFETRPVVVPQITIRDEI